LNQLPAPLPWQQQRLRPQQALLVSQSCHLGERGANHPLSLHRRSWHRKMRFIAL
jgi:hypothetical protein